MYKIPILDNEKIFYKAHNYVVECLGGVEQLSKYENYFEILELGWKNIHKAELIKGGRGESYRFIEFNSEKAATLFVLKWS